MVADRVGEAWDCYNRSGKVQGSMRRGEPVPAGQYHLCVAAFIFDSRGRVVLQRRSPDKRSRPGEWDCSAGGAALQGETPQQAIVREVHEELGLTVTPVPEFARVWHSDWFETWFAFSIPALQPNQLRLQRAELAATALLPVPVASHRLPPDVARQLQAILTTR